MLNKVSAAINDYSMIKPGSNVTVALSGGADSVTLLHCLLRLAKELNITVSAAHLNHLLRGEESFRDENFVRQICSDLSVPLTVRQSDILSYAQKSGESIELAARKVRYEFLESVSNGIIATAHNSDDLLETMIFNLARGTAISGLCGIPPVRDRFIRPLIYCSRSEIEQYCSDNNLKYVTDSSNLCDDYSRNKIRHNVIPVLRSINSSVETAALRTAKNLSQDKEFIDFYAAKSYNDAVTESGICTDNLKNEHPAIIKRVVKLFIEDKFGIKAESVILELVLNLVLQKNGGVVLPTGIKLVNKDNLLCAESKAKDSDIQFKTTLKRQKIENNKKINNLLLKNTLDCDKIVGEPVIRTRKEQDYIHLYKRNCGKTLKKLFTEYKIPLEYRDKIPVIADDEGIIWVYGIGIAKRVAVTEKTENILIVESENNRNNFGGK